MNWSRGWIAALAGVALVAGVGLPAAAAPDPARVIEAPRSVERAESAGEAAAEAEAVPQSTVDGSAAAAVSLPSSAGVTVAGGNSVAVDVLGVGYEQVVRLNGSRVEVVDPVTRGGAVVRSFDVGASQAWPRAGFPMFYGGRNMADRVTGHSASRVAVAGGFIYVSNLRVTQAGPFVPSFPDGSVVRKYSVDGVQVGERVFPSAFAVTALAGFEHEGKPYLAIGLNYSGVRIADPTVPWLPDVHALMEHFKGPDRFGSVLGLLERDQITELGFGVVGDRVQLMVGVLTGDMPALLAFDANTGQELWAKNLRPNDPAKFEWPQEIEFSPYEVNGRVQIAVGWPTLGRLSFMDAVDGTDRGNIDGGVVGTIRFFTDALGEPRVGYRHGRAEGWSSHVAKQDAAGRPVVLDNGAERDLEWMVPGYRPWSIQIDNQSRTNLSFRAFAGRSRGEGCWLGADFGAVPNPLPAQPASVAAGARSGSYLTAHRLRGDSCGDNPGLFYLQVEPSGVAAQRTVVQLEGEAKGVRIAGQVGAGRFVVQAEADGTHGVRVVVTEPHAAPAIAGAPVLEAARLTPAPAEHHVPTDDVNDPSRPVHRFTVTGVGWNVPGAAADLTESTLPLPFAEGSVDGAVWEQLGTVAAPTAPTREGDLVVMGPAVFDWQTAPGAPKDFRYFRITAAGAASNVVDVSGLPAPAPTSVVKKMQITGTAAPRTNGLDQTPLRISLIGELDRGLDTVEYASWYQRVYFRDPVTKALLTGLGDPANPSQLLMFSFRPGQYANDGLAAAASASMAAYFSTRSAQQARSVMAVFKLDGTTGAKSQHSATSSIRAESKTLLAEGTGANGLILSPCAEGICTLADPLLAPALHSLTGTSVSVQLRTSAVPGSASLPLAQPEQVADDLRLHSDSLTIRGSRATLSNPNAFGPGSTITTNLVTHGDRLTLESHYAK